ncbi:MAG: XRE family transcriptional regulator [Bacteroidota bacterium]|jgi:DNA-binding transcriptional regulator YiaG|nr:XRE family transcriptional regulator [Bacteroidota bacterium]
MARKYSELKEGMSDVRKQKIARRTKELGQQDAEVRRLQEIRVALEMTQVELAERLCVNQSAVSKLESQHDMYISTLQRIITALGGELHIRASFPDGVNFEIDQFVLSGQSER